MGSRRSAYAPRAMRLLVSLAGLSLCCLCLAPVATADWETVYCTTTADSLDVATAKSAIAAYRANIASNLGQSCCQSNCFASQCTTFWTAEAAHFDMCGSCRCDQCLWVSKMWNKVADTCAQNYGGVDRVAGYVSYNWSPGFWNHYSF